MGGLHMKTESTKTENCQKERTSIVSRFFRFGIVLSTVLAFMQTVCDLGNRYIFGKTGEIASTEQNRLLKYETPSYRVFGDMFANNVFASPNIFYTGTSTGYVTPPNPSLPGHR